MFNIFKFIADSSLLRLHSVSKFQQCYCIGSIKSPRFKQEGMQQEKTENDDGDDKLADFVDKHSNQAKFKFLIRNISSKNKTVEHISEAIDAMNVMCSRNEVSHEDIKKHKFYDELLGYIKKQRNTTDVYHIIKALESLRNIGVTETEPLLRYLEEDLMWNLNRVELNGLLRMLEYRFNHCYTAADKLMLKQILENVEQKWTQSSSSGEFIRIYKLANLFSVHFLGHIDDQVTEICEKFSSPELSKIFCSIVSAKRRSKPVLRSLSYNMFKKEDFLKPKQIVNTMVAMSAINYSDQALLHKLSKDFISQIDELDQPHIVQSMLICAGKLRWRDPDLITCLASWIAKNHLKCGPKDLKSLLLSMAYLSFVPYEVEGLFETINSRIESSIKEFNQAMRVEIVWSLLVLGKVSHKLIESILCPEFANNIASDDPAAVGTHFKILNVSAAAKYLYPHYKGVNLKSSAIDTLLVTQSKDDRSLKIYVQKVLENIYPPPTYLRLDVLTTLGFQVDAEFILDKDKKPLKVQQLTTNFGHEESKEPLPEGAHRIAVLVRSFKDYTIGTQELTGYNKLAIQLLNAVGYKVLLIPFYDISEKEKITKRIQYVERKISDLLDS